MTSDTRDDRIAILDARMGLYFLALNKQKQY